MAHVISDACQACGACKADSPTSAINERATNYTNDAAA